MVIVVGLSPERQDVSSAKLADLRPGHRLGIEIEDTSTGGQFSVTVEMWPLVSAVTAADDATGHVPMSVDVLSFPRRKLLMRGVVPMPSVINVGDVLDYLSLGQSRKLEPEWRTVFVNNGLVRRMLYWSEPTDKLVDLMSLEPGTVVALRGETLEVGIIISWRTSTPIVLDSERAWDSLQAWPDSNCDMVVRLGQPFHWASGRTDVIAIFVR